MNASVLVSKPSIMTRLKWVLADSWTLTRRNLMHVRHVPEKLGDVTIQPMIFVFMFAYVLGSAIHVPGGDYRSFLMPGIFAQSMAFAAGTTMVGVSHDMSKGIIDRFRSLPMARSAVLIGRTGSDLLESVLGLVVMVVCGLAVGWRTHADLPSVLGAFGLLLLFAFAMSWVGTFVGLIVRSPEAAQAIGFVVIFPITFVANTYVPTEGMPWALRIFADWNPTSALVAACRQLFGNSVALAGASAAWPLQHPVAATLIWCALLVAVFFPLAVRRFRSVMSR